MGRLYLRNAFIFSFLVSSINFSYTQKTEIIKGEFIVQVNDEKDIATFRKQITQNRRNDSSSGFSASQIMQEPFNLWLFTIDYNTISENDFNRQLTNFSKFGYVIQNRWISPRIIPDDPEFSKQWQYVNTGATGGIAGADMDMDLAWDITTGGLTPDGDTIVICVIDDGINASHEDMKENLWLNYHEIPNNGIDDDENGYIDDYRGWDIKTKNDNVYTGGGHGTPVAGIIGAKGNNGIGVSGVNWNVKLMIVNYGSETEANALAAYGYAFIMRKLYNETAGAKGAFVVATNASWGIDKAKADEAPLWCAMYDALGKIGILNCGATTNSNTDVDIEGDLPTSCESEYLISVTNLNKSDIKVSNAGYGRKTIDLGSYGLQAYTVTRTAYGGFGGTSGATPHVTGVIGLLYSTSCTVFQQIVKTNPGAAALIAKDMILHGTSSILALEGITTTGGKLNAHKSTANLIKLCEACSVPAGITLSADDVSIKISWFSDHGSSNVNLRYRKIDETKWTEIKNITKNHIFTGIDYCTEYEFQVGSDCGYLAGEFGYSKFIKTEGCCNQPIFENITSDQSTIHLSWSSSENAEYLLQYTDILNEWKDTLLSQDYFSLNDLMECSGFKIKLKAQCTKYSNSSDFTPEITISTTCGKCSENDYCPFETKDASQEWIETFSIAGFVNNSGRSSNGYRNFAGLGMINFDSGQTYSFNIYPQYGGTSYPDFYKIYIDFNQDGSWSENEMAFKSDSAVKDSVSGTIKIPVNAVNGYTKLRLIMSYEDFEGACDNTEFEYGEIEDYCVYIKNESCINNTPIKSVITEKSKVIFVFEKTDNEPQSVYISLREKGTDEWTIMNGLDSISFTGLKECTVYDYNYNVKCDTLFSEPTVTDTIKTSCQNYVTDFNIIPVILPNPAIDYFTFDLGTTALVMKGYKLINTAGKTVSQKQTSFSSAAQKVYIGEFPTGVYFLEVSFEIGPKIVKKIVKI